MIELDLTQNNYYARGFVSAPADAGFHEYLENNLYAKKEELANFQEILKSYTKVSVICDLWVCEDFRGQGKGKTLVLDFISQAQSHGAQAIILLVDNTEKQREGFNLTTFYKSLGFSDLNATYPGWLIKL